MVVWAWLLAYLAGFALLQLYLYRYFVKSTTSDSPEQPTPAGESGVRTVETVESVSSEDLVSCEGCGAYNESHSMFLFCRECGDRLS